MLRAQDSNGPRMLMLMTEQFLSDPRLLLWRNQNTPMTEKCRQLWEQLGALWVSIVLDPGSNKHRRIQWRNLLEKWSAVEVCPTEDPDYRSFPLVSIPNKKFNIITWYNYLKKKSLNGFQNLIIHFCCPTVC